MIQVDIYEEYLERRNIDGVGPVGYSQLAYGTDANLNTSLAEILDSAKDAVNLILHRDLGEGFTFNLFGPSVVIDGQDHSIDSAKFNVSGGGRHLIKNLRVGSNMRYDSAYMDNLIWLSGGDLELKNFRAIVTKTGKTDNYKDMKGAIACWNYLADGESRLYVDRECAFTHSNDGTTTEGKCGAAAFVVCGQNWEKLPGYSAQVDANHYENVFRLAEKHRPVFSFDGVLSCDYYKATTKTCYGIYTTGAEYNAGPIIDVNRHAVINMNDCPTNIGIHYSSSGFLTLYGGVIVAPSGIVVRGNSVVVPENSTLQVSATGSKGVYNPTTASGQAGFELTLGNALTIENFHAGYGSIQKQYGAGRTGPEADIEGGEFTSSSGYAIASYSHANGSGYYQRVTGFVGSNAILSPTPVSGATYDYATGEDPTAGIYRI